MNANRIVLEVLAPDRYYITGLGDLALLEAQLDRQVAKFAEEYAPELSASFHFMAFRADFDFRPGINCNLIREAVRDRRSPFCHLREASK